jgi:hypothetical protein
VNDEQRTTRSLKRRRNKQRRAQRDADARSGPDQSRVISEFADGWTIRRLTSISDVRREGMLMEHCLTEERWVPSDVPAERLEVFYSLRDPSNYPHLTFVHFPAAAPGEATVDYHGESPLPFGPGRLAVIGHTFVSGHGNRPPREVYVQRVADWQETLPYLSQLWEPPREIGRRPTGSSATRDPESL